MNWKKPKSKIFFVPIPYTGQKLYNLTEYKRNPEAPQIKITLHDPETKEDYTARILDYLGSYDLFNIPDWLSRQCTDVELVTGKILAAQLKKKVPAFNKTEILHFYQLAID